MRFAIGLPNVGAYGDPGLLVELGSVAEQSGWDGVFIWDHVAYRAGMAYSRLTLTSDTRRR